MIQIVGVIIVVSAAVIISVWKLYKFIRSSGEDVICAPDRCAACPFNTSKNVCEEIKHKQDIDEKLPR